MKDLNIGAVITLFHIILNFGDGNKDRVNKRVVFEEIRNKWEKSYLEP